MAARSSTPHSVNSKRPTPNILPYSATKGAVANLTLGLAGLLAEHQIRVNAVLPGPIWTPFIPAGMAAEEVEQFGSQTPFGRPGQPAELASAYVMLASDSASYTSGALLTISGGAARCDRPWPDCLPGSRIGCWWWYRWPRCWSFSGAWLMVRALAWLLVQARQRKLAPELHVGLRRGGALLLYLAAALLILERLGVSRSVLWTALTGFMAVGAVAFFAAWSVLSNLFCSFLIVATRPFRINDTIEVLESVDKPGLCGQVVDINLIYTTLSDRGEGARVACCACRTRCSSSASPGTGVTAAIRSCRAACR